MTKKYSELENVRILKMFRFENYSEKMKIKKQEKEKENKNKLLSYLNVFS